MVNRSPALAIVAVIASTLLVAGCNNPPRNRGQSGYRLDPSHDAPAELGHAAPRSGDLVTATDRMAMDLAARLDVNDAKSPPIIYVGQIENRSSYPNQNYQAFLVRLRGQLQQSGARNGLRFVRERAFIEEQRARELGDSDPDATAENYASRADYVLTCQIFDLPTDNAGYFLFDYQLVQLRQAASGPDLGPGAIVWENTYEVKFQ